MMMGCECHDGCGNDDTNMRGFPLGALLAHILSKNTQVCRFWEIMQTESEREVDFTNWQKGDQESKENPVSQKLI
jgi:hypothetical protein